MRSRFSGRYEFDVEHKWRCDGIATRLYKADKCVINQRGTRWHLSQITCGRDRAERVRAVRASGARGEKAKERTIKPRCEKAQRAEAEPPTDETNASTGRKAKLKRSRASVCFGSKADIAGRPADVRFTPESGHRSRRWKSSALCQKADIRLASFDHLVGAEKIWISLEERVSTSQ